MAVQTCSSTWLGSALGHRAQCLRAACGYLGAVVSGTRHAERVDEQPGRADAFDELALFVLVRRGGSWWLATGLHTPDQREPPHVATSAWTCRALAAAIIFKWIEWISS